MTKLLSVLMVLMLTACQSVPIHKTDGTRVASEAFKLISYDSDLDTKQTIEEIRIHNAKYRALINKGTSNE